MTSSSPKGPWRIPLALLASWRFILVCLLFPLPAVAQDFQVGARAKGMGGSYTAFGDDPVSIWSNPAGPAAQPTQLAITYQSFTQYEFDDIGMQVPDTLEGDPEAGLLEPPISPAFLARKLSLEVRVCEYRGPRHRRVLPPLSLWVRGATRSTCAAHPEQVSELLSRSSRSPSA